MYRLLLVDDEPHVLHALQRELHGDYDTVACTSPDEALQKSAVSPFDLVIADYKMPQMNGIQFLRRFGQQRPDAMRLVLSGEVDVDALIRAVNETHIFRFLAKPWETEELRAYVRQALHYRRVVLENRRLANDRRDTAATPVTHVGQHPYRVMLVDTTGGLVRSMWHELAQPSHHEGLYDVMRREIGADALTVTRELRFVLSTPANADAALVEATNGHYDLVVAGHAPPNSLGTEFLAALRRIRPDCARILVSERTPDKQTLSRAINELQVDAFLDASSWHNPEVRANVLRRTWLTYQLKTAVFQAVTAHELQRENQRLAELARGEN